MSEPDDADLLKQTELSWNRCIEDNRVDDMAGYMSDDWVIFSGDGNITAKQTFLNLVKSGELVHARMDFAILRVRIYGGAGIVMQRGTSAGTWQGQPFSNYEIASTVFIKDSRRWLAVQTMIAPAKQQGDAAAG